MQSTFTNVRFVVLLLLITACPGCGYGEISPTAYQYSKALYSISNRQMEAKLEPVAEQIAAAQTAGELSSREAAWLLEIIDTCRAGEWGDANKLARRMMEDQVQR